MSTRLALAGMLVLEACSDPVERRVEDPAPLVKSAVEAAPVDAAATTIEEGTRDEVIDCLTAMALKKGYEAEDLTIKPREDWDSAFEQAKPNDTGTIYHAPNAGWERAERMVRRADSTLTLELNGGGDRATEIDVLVGPTLSADRKSFVDGDPTDPLNETGRLVVSPSPRLYSAVDQPFLGNLQLPADVNTERNLKFTDISFARYEQEIGSDGSVYKACAVLAAAIPDRDSKTITVKIPENPGSIWEAVRVGFRECVTSGASSQADVNALVGGVMASNSDDLIGEGLAGPAPEAVYEDLNRLGYPISGVTTLEDAERKAAYNVTSAQIKAMVLNALGGDLESVCP